MNIHQLQASYVAEQDRILLRANTQQAEEMRLWLTRRLLKVLLPHLIKAGAATGRAAAEALVPEASEVPAAPPQADYQTPFQEQPLLLPLGAEPLLATTLHITPLAGGAVRLGFEEKISAQEPPHTLEVHLDPPLLGGLIQLLHAALKTAGWDLHGATATVTLSTTTPSVQELFDTATRPALLN